MNRVVIESWRYMPFHFSGSLKVYFKYSRTHFIATGKSKKISWTDQFVQPNLSVNVVVSQGWYMHEWNWSQAFVIFLLAFMLCFEIWIFIFGGLTENVIFACNLFTCDSEIQKILISEIWGFTFSILPNLNQVTVSRKFASVFFFIFTQCTRWNLWVKT